MPKKPEKKKELPESGETPLLGKMMLADKLVIEGTANDNTSAEDLVERIDDLEEGITNEALKDEIAEAKGPRVFPTRMVLKKRAK